MRPAVRAAVIVGVLIVAGCAVYAILFVRSTQMRLDRLEDFLDGRRASNTQRFDQQQQQIDQLCAAVPRACTDVTP